MTLDDAIQTGTELSIDHQQLTEWLKELKGYRELFKTADGYYVKHGDKVFVYGSCGIHETSVKEPLTGYMLFGNIPVSNSYLYKTNMKD